MADSALIAHTLDPSDSESNSELTSPMSSPLAYVASPASDLWKTVEDNANAAMRAAEALKVRWSPARAWVAHRLTSLK
eukprot:1185753-Prorocentrum_minimum.AAC.3